ncbi:tRNA (adenine(22)-N(1))-methyltransferase [Deinococcus cellulosilyticus]|uniref:tRNA (Adenine-N(1))-methyltransferase n=1 Tax=Deinococcus cellulosilyticus (strain DSM 18568 / NBRC 106333 / KACC 11606 / 5516J-15) TaxID=1223518 RepID=A0A511N6H4_DEIC1|nr:class I SAM-dependent methyltransferase [Deinococcus cellulosilyticus]GEM48472.1 tRNA (adenine-N(1))-methyltransferase [Deinococcus cellulosilyticus NBRC 106333 = KACC 11606]
MNLKSLEPRLQTVLEWVPNGVHADIGADHAYLLGNLLGQNRILRGIAVEKNQEPFELACKNLEKFGSRAEARLGDGLGPLAAGEVDSISICGMGAGLMVKILQAHPERVPDQVITQPNDSAEPMRRWAWERGFHVKQETLTLGFWHYPVLHFERKTGEDPSYAGLPLDVAFRFGPHLLKRKEPLLLDHVLQQQKRLTQLEGTGNPKVQRDLDCVRSALEILQK